MLLLYDFLFVLVLTLILTAFFAAAFMRQRNRSAIGAFFVLLFLATWALGLWLMPVGAPVFGGVPWLSFLIAGIALSFLFIVLLPFSKPMKRRESIQETEEAVNTLIAVDIFFWILIIILVAAISSRYF